MKKNIKICLFLLAQIVLVSSLQAQFNIKKPKIKVDKSDISIGKDKSSSSGDSGGTSLIPQSDPSGLFQKVSDDPSAKHHRSKCVEMLELLEAEYAKETANYDAIQARIADIDKSLASAHKIEPNMNSEKFDTRYAESKNLIDADLEVISEMKKISITISNDYNADPNYQSIQPMSYRYPKGYNALGDCYCREWDKTWTHADFVSLLANYRELGQKVPKYQNDKTEKDISDMEACILNGDKYANTVANEDILNELNAFNKQEGESNPTAVISECDEYTKVLNLIKTDPSLNFQASTIQSLDNALNEVAKLKTSTEVYISSGAFDKYLEKGKAERAKLVYMPKPATQNSNLESKAIAYIKGQEYADYLLEIDKSAVVSTLRAVSVFKDYYIRKNDLNIPLYKHKEIVVAYKDADGICQMASVYATYNYEGGGVYTSSPIWGADAPEQIACENVNTSK